MSSQSTASSRTLFIAAASLVIGLTVLGLKFYAYSITGSIALYSDALESLVNVATAIAALLAVWLSRKPADAALPYGYHKAEYFSAVLVGVLIVAAAVLIVQEAYQGLTAPRVFDLPPMGLAATGAATLLNGAWAFVLLRHGRAVRSPALAADARHLITDVISSAGVLVGLVLALATGLPQLDAILAGLVALNILWSGWEVIRESVGGLMDVATPPETQQLIREIIAANGEGAIEAHDIRTRQAGRMTFIDFHLVVPGTMSVDRAHEICDGIEAKLREAVKDAMITIHVEPENKAKHSGIVVL